MLGFLRGVLERDNYDIGLFVVRVLALLIALAALLIGALFSSGDGVFFVLTTAALFMFAAMFPRIGGKVAGAATLLFAVLIMVTGPHGEAGLSGYGFWRSLPLFLLGGLFIRPELTTMGVNLFRPER
jgi:hypothetical protein